MATSLPSERVAVVATIDPDANAAGALTSDWVSMADYPEVMWVIMTGILGASATLDAKVQEATDSSGTGAQDITGKAITQLVKATNDDDQAIINVKESDLSDTFTHIALVFTTGTATSDGAAIGLGLCPAYPPANNNDLASVVEIVS